MISSKYILDIFDLLFDDINIGKTLRQQIPYLTDTEYEYTGVGVFIYFSHDIDINKYQIQSNNSNSKVLLVADDTNISGVTIKDDKNNVYADATVFIKDGYINYLEIWNKIGDYPKKDLETYIMKQEWTSSSSRQIIKTNA